MSSTGRYQSRLFNLFSRQSRRLSDRVAVGWRQAKTAIAWSGQILLYPVYAAYQTTRMVSQQIEQTIQRVLPRLAGQPSGHDPEGQDRKDNDFLDHDLRTVAETADAPILQTLTAAQDILLVQASHSPVPLTQDNSGAVAPALRSNISPGLRRNIGNGARVRSQTTAALLASQPIRVQGVASLLATRRLVLVTIQNQILDVLSLPQQKQLEQRMIWALASYYRSRRFALQQQLAGLLPPLPSHQPHLLLPVRLLRRLMAWVQTSPVAIAANLFREAELMTIAPASFEPVGSQQSQPQEGAVGYRTWQNWFNRSTPKLPAVEASLPPLPAPAVTTTWERWLNLVLRAPANATLENADPAAIVVASPSILTSQRPKKRFGRGIASPDRSQPMVSDRALPIAVKGGATAALPLGQNRQLAHDDRLSQPGSMSSAGSRPTVADRLLPTHEIAVTNKQTAPTAAPTWIETEARLVGYVKHPLEHLLAWLDAGMLWVEKILAKLWQSIDRRG